MGVQRSGERQGCGHHRRRRQQGIRRPTKRCKAAHKPCKATVSITMKAGLGRSLHNTKGALNKQRYRKDLSKAAMRRAAAIVRSQKPLPKRKGSKAAVAKKE